MTPRPRRNQSPSNLKEHILRSAWEQIAQAGAPALSLRAVARKLHITAPAIYNYFPSRDALVTALIVDAFNAFGETQAQSIATIPAEAYAARLRALGLAYRRWAISYPERYQLIFGVPIAGYTAPTEATLPAASRSMASLVSVLASAHTAGKLKSESLSPMTPRLRAMLMEWPLVGGQVDPEVLYLALVTWSFVHGLVSLEINRQYPSSLTDSDDFYSRAIDLLIHQYIQE